MTTTATPTPSATAGSRRPTTIPFGHRFAAAVLVLGAAGNTAEPVLAQLVGDRPDAPADQIQLCADHPVLITTLLLVHAGPEAVTVRVCDDGVAIPVDARRRSGSGVAMTVGLRVVVVDDHPVFRQGLRTLLEELGVVVVAGAEDGAAAVRAVLDERPDVVLMDLQMPGVGEIEATGGSPSRLPRSRCWCSPWSTTTRRSTRRCRPGRWAIS